MAFTDVKELTVYVVEPSHVQARFITGHLKSLGVENIEIFTDGAAVLTKMGSKQPDVVVSSLYLPDMTGTDLIYKIRANPVLKGIAYILISSETNPRYLESIRQAGACAIVPKPFEPLQLYTALMSTLDYLSPDALRVETDNVDVENLHVLIVDDSSSARGFIRRVLENLGIRHFSEAANGKEAVTLIDEVEFDLIFTDYNMPEMDGKELVEYIRLKSWQSAVPVLMISSEHNEGRLASVQQAGVSAICDKPFEPRMVKGLIEKMLAQRQV